MKTSELIDAVALSQGVSKAEAKRNVDAVLDAIRLGIEQDHEVRLTNIGTFRVSEVAARKARNAAHRRPRARVAGRRVAGLACGHLADPPRPGVRQAGFVILLDAQTDGVENGVHIALRFGFRDALRQGYSVDQFTGFHGTSSVGGQPYWRTIWLITSVRLMGLAMTGTCLPSGRVA